MPLLHTSSDLSEAPAAGSYGRLALLCFLFLLLLCCRGNAQIDLCAGQIRIDSLGDDCFRIVAANLQMSRMLRVVPLDSGVTVRGLSFLYDRYNEWSRVTSDSAGWTVHPQHDQEIAAAYLCFNTAGTPIRLAVALSDSVGGMVCSDTINIHSELRRTRCMDVEGMEIGCIYLAGAGGGFRTLVFSIRNRTPRPVHSVSIVDLDLRDTPRESWFKPPVQSGELGSSRASFDSPSHGFPMRLQITVCDSAGANCCTDTVMVIAPPCGDGGAGVKDTALGEARAVVESIIPNPANASVTIRFSLPAGEEGVHLTIADAAGREVGGILHGAKLPSGSHRYTFDTSTLPPGIYFFTLSAGDRLSTGSFQVVR